MYYSMGSQGDPGLKNIHIVGIVLIAAVVIVIKMYWNRYRKK